MLAAMQEDERPASPVLDRLASALLIRRGEGKRTALCFAHLFTASAVFVLGRTVRDTLFLSRYSLDALPWMFVLYGVASAITVVIYARLADRLSRSRTIVVWCAIGALTYLGTWFLTRTEAPWIYPTFYVWSEVFANLAISQFWTLANDLHDPRSARRLFGTIGSARVLGVIVVGVVASSVVRIIGTEQLLFVLVALMAGIALIARVLGREAVEPKSTAIIKPTTKPGASAPVVRDPYVLSLALMLLFAFAALTVGDYQFKAIARATYQEDDLAQFFSRFYAVTGVVSFLFQIFLTPRILARFGVSAGMSVMPAVFGGASVLLLGVPELAIATVMKFADNGFQYTIHDTTLQALYVPFASAAKARTRAFLDAVVKPLSYGLGGVLLLVFAHTLGTIHLAYVSCALVIGWAFAIPLVQRRYRKKLESTLSGGLDLHLDEVALDAVGRDVLLEALGSSDERRVLAALEESEGLEPRLLKPSWKGLLAHPSAAVRHAALERIEGLGKTATAERELLHDALIAALDDPEPEVRAAGARALASIAGDDEVDTLSAHLDDPDRMVRTQVLAAVLRHCAFEGAMLGGSRLMALIAGSDPGERKDATLVLGALGSAGARRLRGLLADPDAEVRLAAVAAAREVADIELGPDLVRALADPWTEGGASAALIAIGPEIVPLVSPLLTDAKAARRTRLAVPRILGAIACEESWAALDAARTTSDRQLRLRVISALGRLRIALGRAPESLEKIRQAITREIEEAEARRGGWAIARPTLGSPLLDEAMDFSLVRARRRVLGLLALRLPRASLQRVRDGLDDEGRRGNALEVLDNILPPSLRGLVMPFFDDAPQTVVARASITPPMALAPLASQLARDPNPYVAMLTLERLTERAPSLAVAEGIVAAHHVEPLVREAAVHALAACAERAEAEPLLVELARDPDPTVARHAARALRQFSSGDLSSGHPADARASDPGDLPMISTVEKLLSLRTAPVFARVRSEDLAPLARVAEVEVFAPGAVLFTEGEPGDGLYVLVRGSVEVRHAKETLATLGPGEAFGEMAVLDSGPRSATAVAASDVQVLHIGSAAFRDVLHEQPAIAEGIIRTLSQRLREANEALEAARRP